MEPPAGVSENIYDMDEATRKAKSIDSLPANLNEAVEELRKSSLMKETLGEHLFERYIEAKTIEWDSFRTAVHPWELEQYLKRY